LHLPIVLCSFAAEWMKLWKLMQKFCHIIEILCLLESMHWFEIRIWKVFR
jgi:hypothetical protein